MCRPLQHREVQGAAIRAMTTCHSHGVCCCFLALVLQCAGCTFQFQRLQGVAITAIITHHCHQTRLLDFTSQCHVQGAPFNIKDFKVLLDAQVYEDLEGRWVDLFNRMKWDIVKSVLKSVAGLQGRKFKVLSPPPP